MAISVSLAGTTIFRPGAYSRTTIDLGGGFPIGPAGLIAVIGEADAGAPGAQETDISRNRFSGDQLGSIRNKYRVGNLIDAANFLFAPAADAAIPSGAQTVWFYKTNNSTRADLDLADNYGTVAAQEYGTGGNRITQEVVMIAETAPVTTGTAFDEQSLLLGQGFSLILNGGTANDFTLASAPTSNADLASQLANAGNWSGGIPAGISITVGGVDEASTLTLTMAAAPNQHRAGWGRSFELSDNASLFGLSNNLFESAVEPNAELIVRQKRDEVTESEPVGGNIVVTLGYDSAAGAASADITIDADNIVLREDAVTVHTFPKSSFATLLDIVNEISLATYAGWSASLTNAVYNNLSPASLDHVTEVGALSNLNEQPARLKKDADDVADFFDASGLLSIQDQSDVGLPDATAETPLSGGTRGVTTTANVIAALEKFQKFHVNSVVPLFSRDATADIADGLTASGSTYTIAGIHQAVKTHLSLMKTIKKRSERQGYLSYKASYEDCKTKAGELSDGRIQLCIQDIRQVDSQGSVRWFQPWGMSAILAGARAGAPIGTPMTFKFMNVSGIRHTAQAMTTADANITIDFDPDLQNEDAIRAGLTFAEAPQTGGFRFVVDNTTYTRDANFVFNRANVLYAADIVAFNFRNAMETQFVGQKNTVSAADIAGFATSILNTFLAQGITVATPSAPNGFKELTVQLEGNTILIGVTVVIVEGIDFVIAELRIQRAQATA